MAVLAAAVLAAGCTIPVDDEDRSSAPSGESRTGGPGDTGGGRSRPTASTPSDGDRTDIARGPIDAAVAGVRARFGGAVGIAYVPVGGGTPTVVGDLTTGAAWSTAKVPVAIAALRAPGGAGHVASVWPSITVSDNAAAERLWESLGSDEQAAAAVDVVLRDGGDGRTVTQRERVHPPYSIFGQTQWALADQAVFAAYLPCRADAAEVWRAMGAISPEHRWGLGAIPNAHFKGGWGPGPGGGYLVRQFGVVDAPGGSVAIAIAASPTSGDMDAGVAMVDAVTTALREHLADLPVGGCG